MGLEALPNSSKRSLNKHFINKRLQAEKNAIVSLF